MRLPFLEKKSDENNVFYMILFIMLGLLFLLIFERFLMGFIVGVIVGILVGVTLGNVDKEKKQNQEEIIVEEFKNTDKQTNELEVEK